MTSTQDATDATHDLTSRQHIELTERYAAHNYHPLPVVLREGLGVWVTDVEGRRYLDCLAGYSALNFGHSNPRLVARALDQVKRLTLTSRAFYNDQLGPFAEDLSALTGKEVSLPMNTGAEAVETAIKVARRWGHEVKRVDPEQASIVVMSGNFHGRTTTIVGFSDDEESRQGFGPFTPGFRQVPFGDIEALTAAVDDNTIAVLLEPIQGESGVIIPPPGYLREVRELTRRHNALMLADEVQSGLGRTGHVFACEREQVVPDIYIMGKALGGGLLPVSAISADRAVMDVITPGSHGSTFGGNPLAAAVGREVVAMLGDEELLQRAHTLGARLADRLHALPSSVVDEVRVVGLWAGIDLNESVMTGRELSERLLERGILAKDTHGRTIRLAPPLVITEDEIDLLGDALEDVLALAHR